MTETAVLLGAGASIEAGVPSAAELTKLLSEYSQHFGDEDSHRIENLVRHLQVQIGAYQGRAASSIDFELTLGTLAEVAANQLSPAFTLFSNNDPLLGTPESRAMLRTRVERIFDTIRDLMDVPASATSYLDQLFQLRSPGKQLDIFYTELRQNCRALA